MLINRAGGGSRKRGWERRHLGRGPPKRRALCFTVPCHSPLTWSEDFHSFYTRDTIHQMLIMCLFSLSAILALVLIAIYILQHFTLGKEPYPNGPRLAGLGS